MTDRDTETAADSPGAAARVLARGETVGKYRLDRVLGSGGMGVVWAAHDPDLDRQIALKLLRAEAANVAQRTRLLREARAMAKLKHPNVMTVYEVGNERDRDYIAMELVDGQDLDRWLETRPPRRDVLAALIGAGRGLAAAHDAGLVHRDFKPHNVLRDRDGRVLVTDFGLARGVVDPEVPFEVESPRPIPATPSRKSDLLLDSTLTQTGAMIGTPGYMAPEQLGGAVPDPRTDQFAFCVTAWQALTGDRSHSGRSLAQPGEAAKAAAHAGAGKLPRALRRVLERGLAVDPKERWPDMRTLLGQLERSQRRSGLVVAILLVAAIVAAGLVTTFAILRSRSAAPAVAGDACNETFDPAWSAATRAGLAKRLADGGYSDALPKWFDGLRTHWIDALARTCAHPDERTFHARLGCLLGARDHVSLLVALLQQVPIGALGTFDPFGFAPPLSACTTDMPPTPPAMPADRATRDRITALNLRAVALGHEAPGSLESAAKQLEVDARAVGWPPIVAEVLYGAEAAARRARLWPLARDLAQRAAMEAAASRDPATEAQIRIDRYEMSIDTAENPRDAFELDRLGKEARVAMRAAGDDPLQHAALDLLDAHVAVLQDDPDRALGKPALAAHETFVAAGDVHRSVLAARYLVDAYLTRGAPADLDAADKLIEATRSRLGITRTTRGSEQLDVMTYDVNYRRPELQPRMFGGFIEGLSAFDAKKAQELHVVDADGKPAAATVWLWEDYGDHLQMPRVPSNDEQVDATGSLRVASRTLVALAEQGEQRSLPTPVEDGATVRMLRTQTMSGKIIATKLMPGVYGCAMAALPKNRRWFLCKAPAADGTFSLEHMPVARLELWASDSVHRVRAVNGVIHWSATAPLDVIVRGAADDVQVWVFRGAVHARTRAEAEALASRVDDVATDRTRLLDQGTATAAGRELYRADDRHVVINGYAAGLLTACAARDETPDAPVVCSRHDMAPRPDAVVIGTSFR